MRERERKRDEGTRHLWVLGVDFVELDVGVPQQPSKNDLLQRAVLLLVDPVVLEDLATPDDHQTASRLVLVHEGDE